MDNRVKDLAVFQINRNIKQLMNLTLSSLEEQRDDIIKLEQTLVKIGFEIEQNAEIDYNKYRKQLLDRGNNTIRELTELINKIVV